MHIHILGICGTFMGGLAVMARQLGHTVTGSDQNVYPPMSTQLQEQGIQLKEGYRAENLEPRPDLVVIGNAMSRGNPEVEAALNAGIPYLSGPQWLFDYVLRDRWVIAIAGTHGKTTTTSMVAWILECAGLTPGFLIGGIPVDFGISARLGVGPFFVVEADEYDTAFFDKRSKFVHYRPRTLILNNLEFDHADIFPDLAAIQRQFHHLVRSVPGNGLIVAPNDDPALGDALAMGCWTPIDWLGEAGESAWRAETEIPDGSRFVVKQHNAVAGRVDWSQTGRHNVRNGVAALAAAAHAGIAPAVSCDALSRFRGVKRRMEIRASLGGITLYDDFAHHPTAIATTLEGLRAKVGNSRIIVVVEPRSNTMKLGLHAAQLAESVRAADFAWFFQPSDLGWDLASVAEGCSNIEVFTSIDAIVSRLAAQADSGDHVVFMSNGGFGGIHFKAESALRDRLGS